MIKQDKKLRKEISGNCILILEYFIWLFQNEEEYVTGYITPPSPRIAGIIVYECIQTPEQFPYLQSVAVMEMPWDVLVDTSSPWSQHTLGSHHLGTYGSGKLEWQIIIPYFLSWNPGHWGSAVKEQIHVQGSTVVGTGPEDEHNLILLDHLSQPPWMPSALLQVGSGFFSPCFIAF